MSNMHTALWCLAAISLLGAAISAARPKYVKAGEELEAPASASPRTEKVAA